MTACLPSILTSILTPGAGWFDFFVGRESRIGIRQITNKNKQDLKTREQSERSGVDIVGIIHAQLANATHQKSRPTTAETPNKPTVSQSMNEVIAPGLLKESPTTKAIPAKARAINCLVRSNPSSLLSFDSPRQTLPLLRPSWSACLPVFVESSLICRAAKSGKTCLCGPLQSQADLLLDGPFSLPVWKPLASPF